MDKMLDNRETMDLIKGKKVETWNRTETEKETTHGYRWILNSSLFLIIFMWSISCALKAKDDVFHFSDLNRIERTFFQQRIDSLKKANLFFNVIVQELKTDGKPIYFSLCKNGKLAGFRPDLRRGGGSIFFENINRVNDDFAFFEEIFHAYQYSFYGKGSMIKDENKQVIGGPNFEYEARVMKGIMAIEYEQVFAETPSQKGLLEFVLSLLDDKDQFSLTHLSQNQQEEYISLVRHFQQHWSERDMDEGLNTHYAHPIDPQMGIDACLDVVKKYNTCKKLQ